MGGSRDNSKVKNQKSKILNLRCIYGILIRGEGLGNLKYQITNVKQNLNFK